MTGDEAKAVAADEGLHLTPGAGAGGYMNVGYKRQKFTAEQKFDGKRKYLGIFFTPEEAALANARAFEEHKERQRA